MSYSFKVKKTGQRSSLSAVSLLLISTFFFQELALANPDLPKIIAQGGAKAKDSKAWTRKLLPSIPESVASIEDAYEAPGSSKTIVLIQDAHTNNSGQFNVAKALDLIFRKNPIKYVFLEAGSGNESLSFLRKYASESKRKQVAKSFLINGKLQGTEYLDLTSNHNFILWGVEDMSLYAKSVATYRAVAKERDKFQHYLNQVDATIKTLKPKIYNPFLLAFDEKYQKFQKEDTPLTAYFEALVAEASKMNISLSGYPHLKALHKLQETESAIDFKKASEEERLAVSSLSSEDQKELLQASKEDQSLFKLTASENQVQKAFFALLEEKVVARLNQYPELSKYFRYIEEAKKIQAKGILDEQKMLEREVFTALSRTPDEENLITASKKLESLKKLFNLTLTPDEFDAYQKDKQSFDIARLTGFLNKKIMDLNDHYDRAVFLESGYEDIIKKCEEFYSLTYERDKKFIENLSQKMNAENQEKAILITGGYHTPNLKYLLKGQGISYVSLTPQVLQETNQKRYEQLLLNQKVDLISTVKSAQVNYASGVHANMLMRILWSANVGVHDDEELALGLADSPKNSNPIIIDMKKREKDLGDPLAGIGGEGFVGGRPIEVGSQYAKVGARLADEEKATLNLADLLPEKIRGNFFLIRTNLDDTHFDLSESNIDDIRIHKATPTIRYIIENGGKAILFNHIGRRSAEGSTLLSTNNIAEGLSRLLNKTIQKTDGEILSDGTFRLIGPEERLAVSKMQPGDILMLENTRMDLREQSSDASQRMELAGDLASLVPKGKGIFVIDGFPITHRTDTASVTDIATLLPGVKGFWQVDEEKLHQEFLSLLANPQKRGQLTVIFGGNKKDKQFEITQFSLAHLKSGDTLILGGKFGNQLIDEKIREELIQKGVRILTPVDSNEGKDIGPETVRQIKEVLSHDTDTLFWEGPLGQFEDRPFHQGTFQIAQLAAELTQKYQIKRAFISGGELGYAFKQALGWTEAARDSIQGLTISTGGGTSIAFLSNQGNLPGTEYLKGWPPSSSSARLAVVSSTILEGPVNPTDAITFIVRVHSEKNQTGKLAFGSLLLDYKENSDGGLTIQGLDEKERTINPSEWIKTNLEGGQSAFQITFSMSDFKQALDAANQTVEEAPISMALNNIKAVGVIDLEGLNPDVKGFDEVVIPLLIEELKLAHKRPWGQNAKFLLKGSEELIQRISSQIPEGQDFIVTKEEDLSSEYASASHILITTPGKFEKGMWHFFIQAPQEGDIPNFRGALRGSLSIARVDKLEATNKDFSEIMVFVGRLLGHDISNPAEYIQVTENPALIAIEKIRDLYSLPAITRLPLNQIVQGARLAIRMIQQAA